MGSSPRDLHHAWRSWQRCLVGACSGGVRSTSADTIPHASFHGLAAALVRPGDAVMATEAAGDGVWRIVQQQSRCRWLGVLASRPPAPSQPGLEWINPARWPEFSDLLDVVITQMAVDAADWHGLLRNAHAPLRRSGRLVLRVPLAHGLDPLSHLVTCLEELELVVDRAWYQRTAGRTGLEQFHEIDRETPLATARGESADAIVLLAVKTGGRGVTQDPSAQVPNIIAFHRDYQDASVVRLIVSMGSGSNHRCYAGSLPAAYSTRRHRLPPITVLPCAYCSMTRKQPPETSVRCCSLPSGTTSPSRLPILRCCAGRFPSPLPPLSSTRPMAGWKRRLSSISVSWHSMCWPSARCWVPRPPPPPQGWAGSGSAKATSMLRAWHGPAVWTRRGGCPLRRTGPKSWLILRRRRHSRCRNWPWSWMKPVAWRLRCG